MNVPCNGCTEREIGCHGSCPRYNEYRAEREEAYKKRLKAALINEANPAQRRAERINQRKRKRTRI